ncbi:hypothetical protein SNEBB_003685 [Seison nebaliae]|nr:hypothetical protein SNEBB_003685 [Seison nebaliae]
MFFAHRNAPILDDEKSLRAKFAIKAELEYGTGIIEQMREDNRKKRKNRLTEKVDGKKGDLSLVKMKEATSYGIESSSISTTNLTKGQIQKKRITNVVKPEWHAPWKLYRVISGHLGWVRSVAVEPGNEWFATGSADRMIKIWDLASGELKLSLTGHISSVRGLAVSPRHPYLFSCGEDKQVKCWDLEMNKVVRHYHGHLSACQCLALHPSLDILVTGGRDSVARLWDMRMKVQIHCLSGHRNTVASCLCQSTDPQIITGSYDSTIRGWDIVGGKTIFTLTNHKKSVRSLTMHPKLFSFSSASSDNVKQWKLPRGEFIQNLSGHNAIINALACNPDNVLISGSDTGSLYFWDWRTGYNFQRYQTKAQPGSIDSECGIYALTFDQSGTRLISCDADKSIKLYKEDETATPETHPIDWQPHLRRRNMF